VIDLPPAPLAKLVGQPAPELAGVFAWKNCEPLKLVDLRGKYVLLEFFGHWCGPCVHRMPQLFELHDRFAKRGLTIIGVHVGLEDESIDSTEKLDAALALSRKELWDDRDIPFPVAMVASSRQKYAGSDQTSRSQVGADYGIRSYPSQVLIDPAGNVVGWFDEVEHLKLFEKLPE
jgi:thiol-disulfide isomerase/thioredoxin